LKPRDTRQARFPIRTAPRHNTLRYCALLVKAGSLRPARNCRIEAAMTFETLVYMTDGAIATITLNRPDALNTIVPPMPEEFEAAIDLAIRDNSVKVIILRGAGRAFCAGYDFGEGFHLWDEHITTNGKWDAGKDFAWATAQALAPTQKFMSMWRAPKPVIAQVHGWCVGGGSDTALCADIVIASEDARIGTPYARMWGC
jgi:enoyl-CoA hydratase